MVTLWSKRSVISDVFAPSIRASPKAKHPVHVCVCVRVGEGDELQCVALPLSASADLTWASNFVVHQLQVSQLHCLASMDEHISLHTYPQQRQC